MSWTLLTDQWPEPFETVWITNGKGWTSLGCFIWTPEGSCWAETNNLIYEKDGEIVSECEIDDLDVVAWHPLPKAFKL